jgi:hypothetical protein
MRKIQDRDFAPIGLLPVGLTPRREYWNVEDPPLEGWNNGIMGTGKMGCWVNGKIRFDDEINR